MKIEASLAEELRADRDAARKFAVIVSFKDQAGVALVRRLGVEPTAVYHNIAAAAAELTAAQIEALAAAPEVTTIEPDQPAEAFGAR
ncbi:MAG: protease inhibitor I9 family protein [Methylotetracoccus sp.]|nr:protease inhibitor I9 family protein [Methylotetracoccus sp.]